MEKLDKVLDDTLNVLEDAVNQKYEQFIGKDQEKRLFILIKLQGKSRPSPNWGQFWS